MGRGRQGDQVGDGCVGPDCGSALNALLMCLAEANFHVQLSPFAKMAHGLLLAIPNLRPFVSFSERNAHSIFRLDGRRYWKSINTTTMSKLQTLLRAMHDAFDFAHPEDTLLIESIKPESEQARILTLML